MSQSTKLKLGAMFGLLMGIVLIVVGNNQNATAKQLEKEGVDVPAQAVGHRLSHGRRGRKIYKLVAEYKVEPGGAAHRKEFSVSRETFDASQNGEPLSVRYLPSDPTVSKLNGESSDAIGIMIGGAAVSIVSVLMGVGGFLQGRA